MRPTLAHASRTLADLDPVMAALVARHGPMRVPRTRAPDYFGQLARSIAFQQLAGRAAEAIFGRFRAAIDGPLSPEAVLALPRRRMRACGFSEAKTESIRDLARKVADGAVVLDGIGRASDESVVERLTQVRGIGRWTAEMFLIFQLQRPDVWPVGDYGVRKGFGLAYRLPAMPTPRELEERGEGFRPVRTAAAWYCWRATNDGANLWA